MSFFAKKIWIICPMRKYPFSWMKIQEFTEKEVYYMGYD